MAENIVRHLGVIMDGNRRWARKHMFTSVMRGHEKGVDTFMDICTWCQDEGIPYLSVYAFSTENWERSRQEVADLFKLMERFYRDEVQTCIDRDIRVVCVGNLDMLDEIQLAALLHKVTTLDPLAVPALTALKMGTEYGARAIGVNDTGKIEAGYKADLTLFSTHGAAWCPRNNLVSQLVYAAKSNDVKTVLVDGHVLMENHELKTLDEERILFEAERCAKRLKQ